MYKGKRELLARSLYRSGIHSLIGQAPQRDCLLVLNYHRIGNAASDPFDPGVFSATADELDEQVGYVQRKFSVVGLEEAQAFLDGPTSRRKPRFHVLITFDDGYLDNYELAFPILRAHKVQGVFFLATGMVGSKHIPWWDRIAFLLRTARKRSFELEYPGLLSVRLDDNGLNRSLVDVLDLYKRADNDDSDRFIRELKGASLGDDPEEDTRRFLDWNEAREMLKGGMAIGSHTHSHTVLSQLSPERQFVELTESRATLEKQLRQKVDSIAYPVGHQAAFSRETMSLARKAGYRTGFSFYGGTNTAEDKTPFDVKRVSIGDSSHTRFRVQTTICRATTRYWP